MGSTIHPHEIIKSDPKPYAASIFVRVQTSNFGFKVTKRLVIVATNEKVEVTKEVV